MTRWLAVPILLGMAGGGLRLALATSPDSPDESIAVVTHVDVLPPFTAEGRALLRQFALESRQEPGIIRVEVFEELARPNHSTVVEVWSSRANYERHLATEPTRAYRAKLQPMLGSPFDERLHRISSP